MKKKVCNPRWGQATAHYPVPDLPCKFDTVVLDLKLAPDTYKTNARLEAWVRRNYRVRYIPEDLLRDLKLYWLLLDETKRL
jgi:hypothetical protein